MSRAPYSIKSVHGKRAAQQLRELADMVEQQDMLGFTIGLIDRNKQILVARGGYAEQSTAHAIESAMRTLQDILFDDDRTT